jgi:hypothetical protein
MRGPVERFDPEGLTRRGVGAGQFMSAPGQPAGARLWRGVVKQVGSLDLAMVAQASLRESERPFRSPGVRNARKSYRESWAFSGLPAFGFFPLAPLGSFQFRP